MGQRHKDEIVYGDDCLTCFEEGETPKYVYARFSNIRICKDPWCVGMPSPPNDRVFKLTQMEDHACRWRFEDDAWQVTWYAVNPPTYGARLIINEKPNWFEYFFGFTLPEDECETFFDNKAVCAEGTCGVGGIGIVTWRLESIAILKSLNMKAMSDIFMEMRPLVDGNRVYKYCRLQDATNIAIEFEPE